MTIFFKLKNLGTCAHFCRRLLELNPGQKVSLTLPFTRPVLNLNLPALLLGWLCQPPADGFDLPCAERQSCDE